MFVAVAAMAFVSCQKEENAPVNETKSATLTLQATVADTKTYIEENAVLWGTGEYVQLYFNDGKKDIVMKWSARKSPHSSLRFFHMLSGESGSAA